MISRRLSPALASVSLCAVLVAMLPACEKSRDPSPDLRVGTSTIAIESKGLQFNDDDARTLSELHDSYQVTVRYLDSTEVPPVLEKVAGKVTSGTSVVLGALRRLPKVEIELRLFRGENTAYICTSGVMNLSKTLVPTLSIPLSCDSVAGTTPAHTVVVKPTVVTLRETVEVSIIPQGASALEKTMALASANALILRQQGTYAGDEATFELFITKNPGRNENTFTAQFEITSKTGEKTLASLKNSTLNSDAVRGLLGGTSSEGILLSGMAQVLARANDTAAPTPTLLPTQISLKAPRGSEWVKNGENRSIRMAFVGEILTVDGTRPANNEPFSGEFILGDEAPAPQNITVATYNVGGMSDDVGAGYPWDYSNQSSNWVKDKMYEVKARHIAEALALAGSPDIVALQEFKYLEGNGRPIEVLWPYLAKQGYKFRAFGSQRKKANGYFPSDTEVVVSKYPIVQVESLPFDSMDASGAARDPLAVNVDVAGNTLRFYTVHTRSKRSEKTPEDTVAGDKLRHDMLAVVRADIDKVREQNLNIDIVVTGDMNANYFETPIKDGLQTMGQESRVAASNDESALYSLWYDLKPEDRCGTSYSGKRECIDQIFVSSSLYDNHAFQYVDNSFRIAGASGLARAKLVGPSGNPMRWETREVKTLVGTTTKTYTTHLGMGYSDHLPLVATLRVIGQTGNASRMTLATAPSEEVNHDSLFVHVRNCTDNNGEFLGDEQPVELTSTLDFSSEELLHRCFRLENGSVPLHIVDKYDTRVDYGFDFTSISPFFKSVSLAVQYNDQNAGGRKIDRDAISKQFVETIQAALAAGKNVSLTKFKGRLGTTYGKLTLFAEELPGLVVTDPVP